ncbi:Methylase involved in ubiquinone/menaquinone biosynthesis [Thermoplasmatales archaeon BRNA1]|nr:Methylase involved in ubiquinone/menaquinone biosynthesis [Thermoplasmatales archaeon BRNA1]
MDPYLEAWDSLYAGQPRSWRGTSSVSWMGIPPGSRVLDAGCGNGKTSASLIQDGCRVTGFDFSPRAVAACRELFGDRGEFVTADVRDLPFGDSSFDCVVAVHILEHVPAEDIPKAVSELLRVLVPGGRIYLQAFAVGDFRSKGRKEDVRNGILYRYFSEADVMGMFSSARIVSVHRKEETTRFGEVRRRLQCVMEKPA